MASRKKLLFGTALFLMLLLTACNGQPTTPNSTNNPKSGGTLVVAMANDPGTLNPDITTAFFTHYVTDQVFNGLVALDDHLNPVPDLATSWSISGDGKAYTFHLRSGVQWQDGQPFSSADVKFTFEHGLLKYHSRTKAGLTPVLSSIDMHIYEGKNLLKDPANLMPIGTGPFKFVEYVKGDHITLQRNPHYFKAGLPYLDKLIFRIIPNATTATQALER